ncbi:MAG: phage terminase large subunit [Candidatus Omnitrophota bacterium]
MNNNISNDVGGLRRNLSKKSLKFFAGTYFKHYCKVGFAPFHLEFFDYLQGVTLKRNIKSAVAAPRGYAKSTVVSLIYALWCICFKWESCMVIFSCTKDQSQKLLSHIKDELSTNEVLRADFPDVCEMPNPRWRVDEIITKNNVNVIVSSVGNRIRGVRYKEERPGLVILDDVETRENTWTAEQRENILDWFTKVVLNLGDERTNFIVCGTVLHFDSLLAKLLSGEELAGWDHEIYKAILNEADCNDLWAEWSNLYRSRNIYKGQTGPDAASLFYKDNEYDMLKGVQVLWKDKESYLDLMVMREQKGIPSFESEKMNEPKDCRVNSFNIKTVIFWDDDSRHPTVEDLRRFLGTRIAVIGACDSAVTVSSRSDYSAIVTAFVNLSSKEKELYVVDADAGRWNVNILIERICIYHKTRVYTTFIYEANAAQSWLGEMLKKQPAYIPIKPITNTEPKEVRIMKIMLLIQQGKVKISKRLAELTRQLSQYPYCAHDDIIDALSMLIDAAEKYASMNPGEMKIFFEKIRNGSAGDKGKKIILYGDRPFNDYGGLLGI